MLSENLKEQTLARHQELEKKLVGKMRAMQSLDDYVLLLQLFYSYFGGLEILINSHISAKILPDHVERRKAGLLSSDLLLLKAKTPLLASDHHLLDISNFAAALGALYVMEGSTWRTDHQKNAE